jgi:hypothetical protein
MSLRPLCFVCDQPVASPYAPEAYCERCKQGCPVCGGDVAFCKHPLPERADLEPRELPSGRFQVAA